MSTTTFAPGNYRYIPAVFQYSAGVAAEPGYEIVRVRFREPMPLKEGFAYIEKTMKNAGRPLTAFCACELRSPAPFTEQGFIDFNKIYVVTLTDWGLFDGVSPNNPVARSNVCPEIDPPPAPSFHAFSYTVPAKDAPPTFVVAGSGEAREGGKTYGERTVRIGEQTPGAMLEKAQYVLGEMERRMEKLGFAWKDSTATQVYTVYDLHPFFASEIVKRGAAKGGLTWHFNRPPVDVLDFEMDCRGVRTEQVV